jgi:hypothetical protein
MSNIVNFPDPNAEDKKYTAEGVLEYLLEQIRSGATTVENLVVIWNDPKGEDDLFQLRYMLGGAYDPAKVIGMIEMAKLDMLE